MSGEDPEILHTILDSRLVRCVMKSSTLDSSRSMISLMLANSFASDDGSIILGTIKSGTAASGTETWEFELVSDFLDSLVGAGIISSKK